MFYLESNLKVKLWYTFSTLVLKSVLYQIFTVTADELEIILEEYIVYCIYSGRILKGSMQNPTTACFLPSQELLNIQHFFFSVKV